MVSRKLKQVLPLLIREFAEELELLGRSEGYVESTRSRLGRMEALLGTLNPDRLESHLRTLRASGLSAKTGDQYGRVARQFGRWLVRKGHLPTNPWEGIRNTRVAGRDDVYVRRAVTLGEVGRLAEAAPERACLYYLAVTTGLRLGELRRLRWEDLDLNRQVLKLPGYRDGKRVTKNGRDALLPLQGWLVPMLRQRRWREPLLDIPVKPAKVIRQDAEKAGVLVRDDQGRVLDFHSLRSSMLHIMLDLGLPLTTVRELMRHATLETTMAHYYKHDVSRLVDVVKIPDPRSA